LYLLPCPIPVREVDVGNVSQGAKLAEKLIISTSQKSKKFLSHLRVKLFKNISFFSFVKLDISILAN
jgi:hypothetical protein